MKKKLATIRQEILDSQNILLVGEADLDGDSAGSILALTQAINLVGKKATPFSKNEKHTYHFLPKSKEIKNQVNFSEYDLIIFLDCGSPERSGIAEIIFDNNREFKVINIDHHISNKEYGDINLVDLESAAAAEIVYFLIKELEIEITQDIASCLLCGLYFDTGFFMHSNTTTRNLEIAGDLLRAGARVSKIAPKLSTQNLRKIKLWGRILERLSRGSGGFIYSVALERDFKELEAEGDDLEGLVNLINETPSKASMLLTEFGEEVKGSLRTQRDDIDLSALAAQLNGGGHRKASGFNVKGKIVKSKNGWKIE